MKLGTILFRSLVALTVLGASASALGDPANTSLEIRKVKHVIDGDGHVLLSVQFTNHGTHPVTLSAISPTRMGPWANINKSVDPGANVKTLMKIDKSDPHALWLTTSEGLYEFPLPPRN